MTRIAIVGVAGRMGRTLVNAVQQDDGATLAGGIVEPGSSLVGADLGELAGAGAVRGEPTLHTREGHPVTYLGGGEFSVTLPGEEAATFRTDDPEFT